MFYFFISKVCINFGVKLIQTDMDRFTLRYYFNTTPHLKRTDGTFPVQLVVYDRNISKRTFILTHFYFKNKPEFEKVYLNGTTNDTKKQMNDFLDDKMLIARSIIPFNIETFKEKIKQGFTAGDSVNDFYKRKILELKENRSFGTASSYECSLNSLKEFWNKKTDIQFHDITISFLNNYERWMRDNEKSATTVGIYLRPLRSIFNTALTGDSKLKNMVSYPFHTKANKNGYEIPEPDKTNKALSLEDIKKIFNGEPNGPDEAKAKSFFIFAYLSNGMNMMDIAKLKYKNISGETFTFYREKTKNTTKGKQPHIEVIMSDHLKQIIEEYGNSVKTGYIFPIIKKGMNPEEQRLAVQLFTRHVNKYLKRYAESVGVTNEISTNWARHSFASILDSNNVSLEFIRQNLGHTSLQTTQKYLSSFSQKDKAKNTSLLTDF